MLFDHSSLCPLDDRYASDVNELCEFFTEPALIRARARVEVEYLIALSDVPGVAELTPFSEQERSRLRSLVDNIDESDVDWIRRKEKAINHDVKCVEYWLREKCLELRSDFPVQFIHFGLTSEDVTNLAYGVLIHGALRSVIAPTLERFMNELNKFWIKFGTTSVLGMTHGQAATPTTIHYIIGSYMERLEKERLGDLKKFVMNGKFGGAVGNFAAHDAAYPEKNWMVFGSSFVESLGLKPISMAKQINPHDDVARLSHIMIEINTILLNLALDMWLYISRGILCEKTVEGEVGSSTMPHKVNPINWENAEGNLGISNALFGHLAQVLPVSRMQRHLSDSTVQRWLGCAFGAHLLAVKGCLKGLGKLRVNLPQIKEEFIAHPDVHSEAIQTVMRRYGCKDAYEQLKELTRGKEVTRELLTQFVGNLLNVPCEARERLTQQIMEHA